MGEDDSIGVDDARTAIEALLVSDADSVMVAALEERGITVEVPLAVSRPGQPQLDTDLLLDLFVPDDLGEVLRIWREAITPGIGAAGGAVHLAADPDRTAMLYIGDYRDVHGVLLAVLDVHQVEGFGVDRLDAASDLPRMCSMRQDRRAMITDIDEATTALLGWSREDLVGRLAIEITHPQDHSPAMRAWTAAIAGHRTVPVRIRRQRKDGVWTWFEVSVINRLDDAEDPHICTEMVDVSSEMEAVEALHERERLLTRLAEALPVGIFEVDRERRVSYSNDRLHEILGTPLTHRLDPLLVGVEGDDRTGFEEALAAVLDSGDDRDLELGLTDPMTGVRRRCHAILRALRDGAGAVVAAIVCLSDITEAVLLRKELEDRATYDALTRCYNRASVMLVLEEALARPEHARTGVIFVDIDNFKPINDRFGHAAGDALLVTLADRLRSVLRGTDVVGRIGGDEFLVVCQDADGDGGPDAIVGRIQEALAQPSVVGGEVVTVTSSIGVATSDGPDDADDLVRRADVAMYESKRDGHGVPFEYDNRRHRASGPRGPLAPTPGGTPPPG